MAVSNRVREIESEIDDHIRKLDIWQTPRAQLLEQLMCTYRDAIELVFCKFLHAETFDSLPQDLGDIFGHEDLIRGGTLWALKWATEYCPDKGPARSNSADELVNLIFQGKTYELFVDALKYAQRDLVTLSVNESSRTITCYEGGNKTLFDMPIIQQGRISSPMTPHISLTENSDQITSKWTAGDYRQVIKMLAKYAATKENTIVVDRDFLSKIGKSDISVSQPTLVWLDRPSRLPACYVFDDLVLPTVIDSMTKWKLVSLLETPIVKIGDRYCAISTDLKAISVMDDYMLRLAARVDPSQYRVVSYRKKIPLENPQVLL